MPHSGNASLSSPLQRKPAKKHTQVNLVSFWGGLGQTIPRACAYQKLSASDGLFASVEGLGMNRIVQLVGYDHSAPTVIRNVRLTNALAAQLYYDCPHI
mmetsp:Transcript_10538/g.38779  ORF Transcript_10538/g.38779 Transcript_10538/m.38779 type:complete len:99 (+) Transcript_10538:389-685(+)